MRAEYTYYKLGIPDTTKFGDGTAANTSTKSRTLDKLGRLSTETMTTDSGVTKTTSYTYKDVPNTDATTLQVTSVTDPLGTHNYTYFEDGKLRESPGELYGYDDLGQLKTSYGPKCYWYDYDNRGNITRKYYYSESGTGFDDFGVYEYTDSEWGDLLTKYNGTVITYGALGNPNNWRDGMSFTWEHDRRLVSVTRNGSSAYYTYDSGGVRRTKTVGNTSLTYEYTDGKLISQTDGTNVWWFYYDADGTRLAMEYNGEKYYYVYNIVGDVKGMYDSEGNVVAKYSYSGYGEPAAIKDGNNQSVKDDPTHIANINPFRFKGYYFDAETEFYYLNTRYYDPYVCRFINADAYISTGQGPLGYNMFAYCQNDPINMSDSDGKMPVRNRMLLMTDAGSYSNGKLSKSKPSTSLRKNPRKPNSASIPSGGKSVYKGQPRICTDGSSGDKVPDKHRLPDTALHHNNAPLDAYTIPYVVIPIGCNLANLGDRALLINHDTGRSVVCVIGDRGPASNGWGEVSIAAIWLIGNPDHNTADSAYGLGGNYEIYIFPGEKYVW